MTLRRLLCAAPVALVSALALSCGHAQQDGRYAFVADQVVKDPCGLLASPDALWDGQLIIDGEVVRVKYDLYGSELDGRYQENNDTFYADGSASQMPGFGGAAACTFDMVNIHLEGTLGSSASTFTGTLRVLTRTLATPGCECELETTFHADRAP